MIQSHRRVVSIPKDATTCEHPSLVELVECELCQGKGVLYDPEMRRKYKAQPIPWNSRIRERETFVVGYDQ